MVAHERAKRQVRKRGAASRVQLIVACAAATAGCTSPVDAATRAMVAIVVIVIVACPDTALSRRLRGTWD